MAGYTCVCCLDATSSLRQNQFLCATKIERKPSVAQKYTFYTSVIGPQKRLVTRMAGMFASKQSDSFGTTYVMGDSLRRGRSAWLYQTFWRFGKKTARIFVRKAEIKKENKACQNCNKRYSPLKKPLLQRVTPKMKTNVTGRICKPMLYICVLSSAVYGRPAPS
jgi:hypothetical protein